MLSGSGRFFTPLLRTVLSAPLLRVSFAIRVLRNWRPTRRCAAIQVTNMVGGLTRLVFGGAFQPMVLVGGYCSPPWTTSRYGVVIILIVLPSPVG